MGQVEKRLQDLGIDLPVKDRKGSGAIAAKQVGTLLFLSAQLPVLEDGTLLFTGRVGTDLTTEQGYEAARLCGLNMLAQIADCVGDLDHVKSIVKVLGLVNSGGDFSSQPAVINGFSDLMLEVFGTRGMHARSAMGAFNLPQNAPVTVDCVVELR